MTLHHRLAGPLLLAGVGALAVTVPLVLAEGRPAKELPWVAGISVFLVAAAVVRRRRPDHPVAGWFAVAAGLSAVVQAFDALVAQLGVRVSGDAFALLVLLYQVTMALGGIAIAHLLGLFPDGRAQRPYGRRVLAATWWLLVFPPLAMLASPTLVLPSYHQLGDLNNPFHVAALAPLRVVAAGVVATLQGVFVVGLVLLVLRYRRADTDTRRRIRWLLPPTLFAAAVAVTDVVAWRLYPDGPPSVAPELFLSALWILAIASLPIGIAIALLRPTLLDVDRVIRRSLVYGLLWLAIAGVYVGAAATLGLAAGRRLPLGVAIVLTVIATLLFQPARQRLERLADRWVFGVRSDPARMVARLGAALEETVELESLLPRMADTLQEGLGVTWARVRLDPASPTPGEEPVLTVPIMLGDDRLGVVECGPKRVGSLSEDDEAVVATLARQAALAVRNVRLTAELERSRARLVRAQDAERRRLERNLHDGVQQDLVALMGQTAYARSELARDPAAGQAALDELQTALRDVLGSLRELAQGIHPSVLTDRGLLEAVEALAARSRVPISVRAEAELRGVRFAEEIEGAGYFTVAEALANAGKHAGASRIDVSLARTNGSLSITVHDDGVGFDLATATGQGLVNLAERLAALGGHLEVDSGPGRGTTLRARLRTADG